jgi:hypothetical protein
MPGSCLSNSTRKERRIRQGTLTEGRFSMVDFLIKGACFFFLKVKNNDNIERR